jgi:hypothetical protein
MEVLRLSNPSARHRLMTEDVKFLYAAGRFTSCVLLTLCFLDALASDDNKSDRRAFFQLVKKEFPILMTELAPHSRKPPAEVLYDAYRNGLVHGLGPKGEFALCRSEEVAGSYVAAVHVPDLGERIGLNVDRLTSDFLALVERRQRAAV